jgi:hypothetical protein
MPAFLLTSRLFLHAMIIPDLYLAYTTVVKLP